MAPLFFEITSEFFNLPPYDLASVYLSSSFSVHRSSLPPRHTSAFTQSTGLPREPWHRLFQLPNSLPYPSLLGQLRPVFCFSDQASPPPGRPPALSALPFPVDAPFTSLSYFSSASLSRWRTSGGQRWCLISHHSDDNCGAGILSRFWIKNVDSGTSSPSSRIYWLSWLPTKMAPNEWWHPIFLPLCNTFLLSAG